MKRGWKFELHDFYCIKCGQRTMTLPRNAGHKKEKFHRKILYCPHCQLTLNQVECRNEYEAYEFKQLFNEGAFENEAEESLSYVRDRWSGEKHLA